MIQTIKKGRHRSTPRSFRLQRRKDKRIKVTMSGPGLIYDHGNNDNLDWNKLTGGSFSWWQPHGRSFMVAWRYKTYRSFGIEIPCIELTPYYHNITGDVSKYKKVGSVPGFVDEKNTLLIPIDSDGNVNFHLNLIFKGKYLETRIIGQSVTQFNNIGDTVQYHYTSRYYTPINPWFGGNQKAKGDIFIQFE